MTVAPAVLVLPGYEDSGPEWHLNSDSALGSWPEGASLLADLMAA